ncbi:MAG: Gfo/Idh/MocA family oxidoreductase [Melioribacteraceae bacterium]|nr:Gfo/Idh/MocA family oxidoreductase [Melioribacteraceae bacterium]
MNSKKINFAIIGYGRIGERHAEHITKMGNLVAACDIKEERRNIFNNSFKANFYSNIDDLLKFENNIDVVSICTPNGLHSEHTIKSLKAGHHVLVEKPMALSVLDCEAMIKASEDANKRLFVVKQNRFNPPIQTLKKVMEENRLGRVLSVQLNCFWNRNEDYYKSSDWKGTKKLDGGTLFTQFSHFIDLLYWLFGNIKDVSAFLQNINHKDIIEFEDTGVVIVRFENDIIGTINYTVNCYKKNMEGSLTVFGEKGTIKIGGQYLNVLEYQEIQDYIIMNLPDSGKANDYGGYQGSMSNHDKVYENVIDVLTNNGKITTNFLDGMKTVQIIEKIYVEAHNV